MTQPVTMTLVAPAVVTSVFFLYRYDHSRRLAALYAHDELELASPQPISSPAVAAVSENFKVPILMYHYVEHVKNKRDVWRQKLNTPPEVLDEQLTTLERDGYTFLFMSELDDVIDGNRKLPEKPIILTFDDGYRDFYTDALPILKKHQAKSTAYIITQFLGQKNNITQAELQEMNRNSLIEIGSHTQHHIDLEIATHEEAAREIIDSKKDLEKFLGKTVSSFAYPSGRYNQDVVKIVQDAGYRSAVTTQPGVSANMANRLILFRLRPELRTGSVLLDFLKEEDQKPLSLLSQKSKP